MREGKCGLWFGSSSLSLFTTRECCRRKATFNQAFEATKLRKLITPVSILPGSVVQREGKHMQDGSVTVERRKRGMFGASGGERVDRTAEKYTAASFLEPRTT